MSDLDITGKIHSTILEALWAPTTQKPNPTLLVEAKSNVPSPFFQNRVTPSTVFIWHKRASAELLLWNSWFAVSLLPKRRFLNHRRGVVADLKYIPLQTYMVKIQLNFLFAFLDKQNPYYQVFQRSSPDFHLCRKSVTKGILKFKHMFLSSQLFVPCIKIKQNKRAK